MFGREWLRVQRLASGNVPSSHASLWVLATWPVPAAGWALAAEQALVAQQVSYTPVEAFHLARYRLAAPSGQGDARLLLMPLFLFLSGA